MKFEKLRQKMVEEQLIPRGINDQNVLNAFRNVKRDLFVPNELKNLAYDDRPLPIGNGQTISQPYIVAKMTQLLECNKEDVVLEIGGGSGYQSAILSYLVKKVFSMERIKSLRINAEKNIKMHNIKNVFFINGDGSIGLSQYSPFNKIIITAASPQVPQILIEQLADNGILLIPLGGINSQRLVKIKKIDNIINKETFDACRFVPLLGKNGFNGV